MVITAKTAKLVSKNKAMRFTKSVLLVVCVEKRPPTQTDTPIIAKKTANSSVETVKTVQIPSATCTIAALYAFAERKNAADA
ncbi:hypothetical protein LNQ82_02155 [Conchiformibius steedae DSM 2580]|uniref:Uncharacterized protein n=1 Tax=Conchiformibius steedae DSM 2580 TaxID=1121352 RepID=A0AAE9HYF8_9NEIS|nr:hypothetical protein [Conchiformibius steedae]URD68642.1 hypothetical protein LNQ82_02155 [Conchiformibius steedae DSM 2580]